ncbi:DUF6670 family protein [Corynebacterium sp. CNJ-954]|uniref:DUF6670 family protein n=1 Tax=Corynebacterium sp. CNJ-954 TaxID=1904962 RepID=UPI001115332A|nr:DUF6670 family protein [Corynebacterium sp. CNJ-954]
MSSIASKIMKAAADIVNPPMRSQIFTCDPFPFEDVGKFHSWRHYGVMIPDIGETDFFDIMNIIGTPGVSAFDVQPLQKNTHNRCSSLLSTTGRSLASGLEVPAPRSGYCIDPTNHKATFGSGLEIIRSGDILTIHRNLDDVSVDISMKMSKTVSVFANIPGIYKHWSTLAHCSGMVQYGDEQRMINTLGTVEFARGIGTGSFGISRLPDIPVSHFSYHVLNISDSEQLLMTDVALTGGIPVQQRVFYRNLGRNEKSTEIILDSNFHAEYLNLRPGPDARSSSRVPDSLHWSARDRENQSSVTIDAITDRNWKIGIGTGYCGTYQFTGDFTGRQIAGQGYIEHVDLR